MEENRKNLEQKIRDLNELMRRLEYEKDFLVKSKGEGEYLHFANYLQSSIDVLEAKKKKLPIGHRYTGTFYLRVPYSSPARTERFEGSIFMKEDLVSWHREHEDAYGYHRAAYKDPEMKEEIQRTDGEAVFEN